MLAEVKVGPPVITISQSNTFMVATEGDEVAPDQEVGLSSQNTHLISSYRFCIDGSEWRLPHCIGVGHSQGKLTHGLAADQPKSSPVPAIHLPGSHPGRVTSQGAEQKPPLYGGPRINRSSIVKQTELEARRATC